MEPKRITPEMGNHRNEVSINPLIKISAEKNSVPQNKNLSEKKCVHRTETGFCKRSNKQCPLFLI